MPRKAAVASPGWRSSGSGRQKVRGSTGRNAPQILITHSDSTKWQNALICVPQLISAKGPQAAPNGGSARGYQELLASLAAWQSRLRPGGKPARLHIYASLRLDQMSASAAFRYGPAAPWAERAAAASGHTASRAGWMAQQTGPASRRGRGQERGRVPRRHREGDAGSAVHHGSGVLRRRPGAHRGPARMPVRVDNVGP